MRIEHTNAPVSMGQTTLLDGQRTRTGRHPQAVRQQTHTITDHEVTVYFLRSDERYAFTAVSVDGGGNRTETAGD